MSNFEVVGASVDYRNVGTRHMAQECNQCRDSRIAAAHNHDLELFMSRYIEWQKRHNYFLRKHRVGLEFLRSLFSNLKTANPFHIRLQIRERPSLIK